jgi:type IV secretory pathway VirB4 component
MPPKPKIKKAPAAAVLPFSYLREGTVIMRDGSLRAVLLASSINFYLKSETEQNAIVSGYIGFLNTLSFPLQIVIQSRRLNIDGYLAQLEQLEGKQTNELLRLQTADYRQFVKELLELEDIMTKRFYVVIPYDPAGDKTRSFISRLTAAFSAPAAVAMREEKFRHAAEDLGKRVALVQSGLGQIGISTVSLDTPSLIELFYRTYNQEVADTQPLAALGKLQVENS